MNKIVTATYDGKNIEFVRVDFKFMTFRQRLSFCWDVLIRKYFAVGTTEIKVEEVGNE